MKRCRYHLCVEGKGLLRQYLSAVRSAVTDSVKRVPEVFSVSMDGRHVYFHQTSDSVEQNTASSSGSVFGIK